MTSLTNHDGLIYVVAKSLGIRLDEDMMQDARVAVIKAMAKFDETKGTKISAYLSTTIRNSLYATLNYNRFNSLVEPLPTGFDEPVDENIQSPEDFIMKAESELEVRTKLFSVLTKKERSLLCSVHGLCDKKQKKISELATELGVSRQWIYEILKQAYNKIKKSLEAR